MHSGCRVDALTRVCFLYLLLILAPSDAFLSAGCRFKGRVFPNGDEWHPTVQPFGEVKCVNCHCKVSTFACKEHN